VLKVCSSSLVSKDHSYLYQNLLMASYIGSGKELKGPKVLSHAGDVPIQEMWDCRIGDER